jgi:chemotaxis protein methyltransferase CheR
VNDSRQFAVGSRQEIKPSVPLPLPTANCELPTVLSLSDEEFHLFQALIYREAGIHLTPLKKPLLISRLGRRLRQLGARTFGAYYRMVVEDRTGEMVTMLDAVCTNETHFFREPRQFDYLQSVIVPAWRAAAAAGQRAKSVRVWSAACSTGEEPYSIAMLLRACFADDPEWRIEIVATDLSTRVLEQAREGLWPIERAANIPEDLLRSSMLRGRRTQEGWMKAKPELREMIKFARVNLNDDVLPVAGPFDLIFCRNVLIYFDDTSKSRVIEKLLARLAPDGHILLGHSESLSRWTDRVRSVGPTIYVPLSEEVRDARARR